MKRLRLTPEAELDLDEAHLWYHRQAPDRAVGCWCMSWRIGSASRKRPRDQNRVAFREIVRRGQPPGLLAFDGEVAVGWCQLTPRDAVPWLDRAWRLKRLDEAARRVPARSIMRHGLEAM